jgi:ferric-dicitrate binding protein FerR (iron transport regulator)
MSDEHDDRNESELFQLAGGYCNGTLGAGEFARLEQLLLNDAEARAVFRRLLALDAALRDFGDHAVAAWSHDLRLASARRLGAAPRRTWSVRRAAGAVAALVGVAAAVVLLLRRGGDAEAAVIGALENVAGDVRITAADGTVRAISSDAAVRSGDTVRTSGAANSTVMTYADGTRLTLVGDTAVTFGDSPSKSIVVHQGMLGASVEPQPREAPMLLATPSARLQVLGTRFLVGAAAGRTDLSVTQGLVRMIRIRDGAAVDVGHGKRAVVTERRPLVVESIPEPASTWNVDFEDGLPESWDVGRAVSEELPAGSRGGVIAERIEDSEDGPQWAVITGDAWVDGLFVAGERTHLHVTFKKQAPGGWINVFVITRTADPSDPQHAANFLFNDFPRIEPDRWHTATIPLAKFESLHRAAKSPMKLVPYKVTVVAPDRGLTIDRIWATADGPGEFEMKPLD